jgi:hypothetical protein
MVYLYLSSWRSGWSSKFCGLLIHHRRGDRAVGSGDFFSYACYCLFLLRGWCLVYIGDYISNPLQCRFIYSYVILMACFLQDFLPKSCMHFSYITATYPAHLILLDLVLLVIFGEKYKLWFFSHNFCFPASHYSYFSSLQSRCSP